MSWEPTQSPGPVVPSYYGSHGPGPSHGGYQIRTETQSQAAPGHQGPQCPQGVRASSGCSTFVEIDWSDISGFAPGLSSASSVFIPLPDAGLVNSSASLQALRLGNEPGASWGAGSPEDVSTS